MWNCVFLGLESGLKYPFCESENICNCIKLKDIFLCTSYFSPLLKNLRTEACKMTPFSWFREFAPPIEKIPPFLRKLVRAWYTFWSGVGGSGFGLSINAILFSNGPLGIKFRIYHWNFNRNTNVFIEANVFQNIVCKAVAICMPSRHDIETLKGRGRRYQANQREI